MKKMLLICLALLAACTASRGTGYAPMYDGDRAVYATRSDEAESAPKMSRSRAPQPPPAPMAMVAEDAAAPMEPAAPPPAERMVHYNGHARLLAARPEELVLSVAELAEGMEGEVERMSSRSITIRVPVERFQEVFDRVLELGEVLSRSITAEDVTEAYTAVDLRLQTAETARTRLQELLARATEEEQKLELLKQIQRLTEEIDLLQARVRLLKGLAERSRITVEAVPRPAVGQGPAKDDMEGFRWIRQLSPWKKDLVLAGRRPSLEVPEGFVLLDLKRHLVAESADGAMFRSAWFLNDPEGDAMFWAEAIQERLAPDFAEAEILEAGPWVMVRFVEQGDEPYSYLVGVKVEGRKRHLVEVYYPSSEQEERYREGVQAVLEGRVG